jgi:hypothetical protein
MARSGLQKVTVPFQSLPPVARSNDKYGHFFRYRITSDDSNRYSHWSPALFVEIEEPLEVSGKVTTIGTETQVIQVTWDDEINNPSYDVFVQFTLVINQKSLTSNVATLRTTGNHQLVVGDQVTISGVDATFNGTYTIISVPATNLFSYSKIASNVAESSSSGNVVCPFKYHGTPTVHFYSLVNNVAASAVKARVQVASQERKPSDFLKIFETPVAISL